MSSRNGTSTKHLYSYHDSRLAHVLRSLRAPSETERPFVPVVGGPRLFFLMLYASVVVVAALQFFASKDLWYGSWNVFNAYVFTVTGLFVLLGLIMLFMSKDTPKSARLRLPFPRFFIGVLGLAMFSGSAIALVTLGDDLGGIAVILSVVLLFGFVLMILGANAVTKDESIRLGMFGCGMILMTLVPVHEAFGVAQSAPGDYPFTMLNLVLLVPGVFLALFAVNALRTRDGFLGAWLIGAMIIFLIAFHEQVGIISSENYEPYDRSLALVGITFSFLPLAMYVWREREYTILWMNIRAANGLVERGQYAEALRYTDTAIEKCSRVAIMDRFSLPWSLKADVLYRMRDYSKAKSFYDVALEIDPDDSVSWCHLGCIHAYAGRKQLALTAFDLAIKHDPENAVAWNNKGAMLQSLGMLADARSYFERAVDIDPNSFDAHFNLGKACARLGRSDEAVVHFQKAHDLDPESEDAVDWLQRTFYKGMCQDQIRGWAQLGLDTTYMQSIFEQDPEHFVERSKEFLTRIAELELQLSIGSGSDRIDVTEVIKKIMKATEENGATLSALQKATGLTRDQLVLPIALLTRTDKLHFKTAGKHELYLWVGKVPTEAPVKKKEKPPAPPKAKPKPKERPPAPPQVEEPEEQQPEEVQEEEEELVWESPLEEEPKPEPQVPEKSEEEPEQEPVPEEPPKEEPLPEMPEEQLPVVEPAEEKPKEEPVVEEPVVEEPVKKPVTPPKEKPRRRGRKGKAQEKPPEPVMAEPEAPPEEPPKPPALEVEVNEPTVEPDITPKVEAEDEEDDLEDEDLDFDTTASVLVFGKKKRT